MLNGLSSSLPGYVDVPTVQTWVIATLCGCQTNASPQRAYQKSYERSGILHGPQAGPCGASSYPEETRCEEIMRQQAVRQ